MPVKPPSDQLLEQFAELYRAGNGCEQIGRIMGKPATTLKSWLHRIPDWRPDLDLTQPSDQERTSDTITGDARHIQIVTHEELRTVDDVVEYCEIDLARWEIVKCRITSHKQGQTDAEKNPRILAMVNVALELKARAPNDPLRAKNEVIDLCKQYAPKIRKPTWTRRKCRGELLLEISVPDIHIGKLSDANETGESYNLEIARSLYLKAHDHIINQACGRYEIGQVLSVQANDIMHFAGSTYATTKGTRQDYAGTWQRVYRTARETATDAVMMCREVGPTRVITHPDNHAADQAFFIGDALHCYFHADGAVEVDSGPEPYKFHRHGNCLIGLGHGDRAKYPQLQAIMAKREPEAYVQCAVKEWHLGHLHHEQMIAGYGGMVFRRLSSLSAGDSWHATMGYDAQKSAMGFIWSRVALEGIVYFTPTEEDYHA